MKFGLLGCWGEAHAQGTRLLERRAGIGPASRAWEARVLPLYERRVRVRQSNHARPTRLLGELVVGVPLEHFGDLGAR